VGAAGEPGREARPRGFAWLVGALLVTYLGIAACYVAFGRVNHDEGWYLYAARRVYEGALPYRDFAYFQAPLLPFVYGLPQQLFGGGLLVGRLTSFVLGAATVALGARLACLRGASLGVFFFLATVCLTPELLWAYSTTRTEPLSAFWLMLCAFLLLARPPTPRASAGAFAAGMLAAGTRLTSLPAAALVFVWVLRRHGRSRRECFAVLAPGLVIAGLLVAVALAASPDVAFFNLVTAQTERDAQLGDAPEWGAARYVGERLRSLNRVHAVFGVGPVAALACAFGVATLWLAERRRGAPFGFSGAATGLAALAWLAYLPNLVPYTVHPVYLTSAYPLFLVLVAWCVGECGRRVSPGFRRALWAGMAAVVVMQAGVYGGQRIARISLADPDLPELREVAEYLAEVVAPDSTLFTLDSYLAVESHRGLAPGWEMDVFSFFPERSEEEALRYRIISEDGLIHSLRSPAVGAVALSDRALGVLLKRRHRGYAFHRELSEAELHAALPALGRFRLARVFPSFGQFRDRLYVLLPDGK
jgi:hypothetical protein